MKRPRRDKPRRGIFDIEYSHYIEYDDKNKEESNEIQTWYTSAGE